MALKQVLEFLTARTGFEPVSRTPYVITRKLLCISNTRYVVCIFAF